MDNFLNTWPNFKKPSLEGLPLLGRYLLELSGNARMRHNDSKYE
jgi:hypothetical protein